MPVYKLLEEMPYTELLGWINYFEQRPVEWREDDRTHKLLQAQGVKEKPWKLFPTLDAIYNRKKDLQEGQFDVAGFKGSAMFQKIALAVGGDKLDLSA